MIFKHTKASVLLSKFYTLIIFYLTEVKFIDIYMVRCKTIVELIITHNELIIRRKEKEKIIQW